MTAACANYQDGCCLARTETLAHGYGLWPVDLNRGARVQTSCPFPTESRAGGRAYFNPALEANFARQQSCRDFSAESDDSGNSGNSDLVQACGDTGDSGNSADDAWYESLRQIRRHHDSVDSGNSGNSATGWLGKVLLSIVQGGARSA